MMLRNLYFLDWREGSGVKMPSVLGEDWTHHFKNENKNYKDLHVDPVLR